MCWPAGWAAAAGVRDYPCRTAGPCPPAPSAHPAFKPALARLPLAPRGAQFPSPRLCLCRRHCQGHWVTLKAHGSCHFLLEAFPSWKCKAPPSDRAPASSELGELHSPIGRPRTCWGDGRAKRNRRVSWLMTCKEATLWGGAQGRVAARPQSPPPLARAPKSPRGVTPMSRADRV